MGVVLEHFSVCLIVCDLQCCLFDLMIYFKNISLFWGYLWSFLHTSSFVAHFSLSLYIIQWPNKRVRTYLTTWLLVNMLNFSRMAVSSEIYDEIKWHLFICIWTRLPLGDYLILNVSAREDYFFFFFASSDKSLIPLPCELFLSMRPYGTMGLLSMGSSECAGQIQGRSLSTSGDIVKHWSPWKHWFFWAESWLIARATVTQPFAGGCGKHFTYNFRSATSQSSNSWGKGSVMACYNLPWPGSSNF